ncbi:Cytidine deaminase [Ceraceosorus bombacis]|uniref:Cytidine deaminase n=1 Tax=Ceraceosorus bombacis TaxID=401625 RepID=A0A0P1BNQ6_9BASI|nr:Cytidine deaminase [Ceraceosorus bombacis]
MSASSTNSAPVAIPISSAALDQLLVAAVAARKKAYSPYSKFRVGAALLLQDGTIVDGANVENASYGAGICAERTALSTWRVASRAPSPVVAIAVSSDLHTPCPPCGICRQFIREHCSEQVPIYMPFAPPKKQIEKTVEGVAEAEKRSGEEAHQEPGREWTPALGHGEDTVKVMTLEQLLPLSFGPESLQRPAVV